jgi:hypothetical protein
MDVALGWFPRDRDLPAVVPSAPLREPVYMAGTEAKADVGSRASNIEPIDFDVPIDKDDFSRIMDRIVEDDGGKVSAFNSSI